LLILLLLTLNINQVLSASNDPSDEAALLASPSAARTRRGPSPPATTGFTYTPTATSTFTATPTLISGVLSCDTVAPGLTCTDYGTYLDYNINIVVTGLTGGATANDNFIGTYRRTTNGGEMGMTSDFTHCETSGYIYNTVSSAVHIQPFDAAGILYPVFASSTGTDVCVTNNVVNDWRSIGGSGGWSNWLSVKGNVDWPITGYSIVGHIYLYSNQNFMTVTPTSTPTATFTPSLTATPTVTKTATQTPTNTPPPNSGGSGICWESGPSWPDYTVYFSIDRNTIPVSLGWDSTLQQAAQTWTSVTPSHFEFIFQEGGGNLIKYEEPNDNTKLAGTAASPSSGPYSIAYTKINPLFQWDTNIPPASGSHSLLAVMTHEFGHWLFLYDIYHPNCSDATMYYSVNSDSASLSLFDINAINYQYP
jgi:hypothetical protein